MKSPCCVSVYILSVSFVHGKKANSQEICNEIYILFFEAMLNQHFCSRLKLDYLQKRMVTPT